MAAAETARLIASLELQDKNFTRGLKNVERGIGRVDKRLGAVSGFLNRNMARALDSLASRGVDALASTVEEASNLNEEIGKSSAVFGNASKDVIAWADTTSSALGIAKVDALGAAGAFGNMFKTTGFAEKEAAGMSKRMVELAADMASFNNEDPNEMLDKLRSGLSGEAEPLRRFGVLLSEAAVKEKAYASGIAKRGKKLTESQKVAARYALILEQTAVQQGDVAKTGGNLAGQQRKLNALMKDASATIGMELLPVVTDLTSEFVKLLQSPAMKQGLKSFAKGLGQAAKDLVSFAGRLPWEQIGQSLQIAGAGAKAVAEAFLGLPPWIQTAVLTGWGLNKLTGGKLFDVGKIAFDFLKGRGSTPANPLFVADVTKGLGGGAPVPGGGGIGAALKGIVTDFGAAVAGLGLTGAVGLTIAAIAPIALFGLTKAIIDATGKPIPVRDREGRQLTAERRGLDPRKVPAVRPSNLQETWYRNHANLIGETRSLLQEEKFTRQKIEGAVQRAGENKPVTRAVLESRRLASAESRANKAAIDDLTADNAAKQARNKAAIDAAKASATRQSAAQKSEIARAKQAAATAGRTTTAAARTAGITTAGAMTAAASRIVGAVNALDLSVNVTTVNRTSTVNNRYGPSGGSSTTNRSGELE